MERIKELFEKLNEFEQNDKIPFSKLNEFDIPKKRGCYILFDKDGIPIYVGRTKRLLDRLNTHHQKKSGASPFRNKLMKHELKLIPEGLKSKEIIEWLKSEEGKEVEKITTDFITKNCLFLFKEIKKEEEEKRFEHFLIALLNPKWND